MTEKEKIRASKFICLVLRHNPQAAGIDLDKNGWADTQQLLAGMAHTKHKITLDDLKEIVATDEKQRYKFGDDFAKIRANQGHSVKVDVEMKEATPPTVLYHGTAARFLDAIKAEGLRPKNRLHVHLSIDEKTAVQVGGRHGKPAVLIINAADMHKDGHRFYISENGIWLTNNVPPQYINFQHVW